MEGLWRRGKSGPRRKDRLGNDLGETNQDVGGRGPIPAPRTRASRTGRLQSRIHTQCDTPVPIAPLPSLTIATLLKRDIRPVIFALGGRFARSGIPLTDALVTEIAKWGYL